jgi:hypothetical protein
LAAFTLRGPSTCPLGETSVVFSPGWQGLSGMPGLQSQTGSAAPAELASKAETQAKAAITLAIVPAATAIRPWLLILRTQW